jgi:anaerobic ribonucleoside-triphosphate reductase
MQQGLYLTSDDEPHAVTDKIANVLKQASLSIGYVGLAETMLLLTGKTYGIDHEIDNYAYSIVKTMREFVDKTQKETHLNWSCFATPAEAVAGRFANIDKNLFQNEKKLADVDLQRVLVRVITRIATCLIIPWKHLWKTRLRWKLRTTRLRTPVIFSIIS